MHRYVYAAFVAVGVPFIANASVVISEVAWMGSSDNANAEWIELYNDGPAQDLSGWTLNATDGQPAIALSGTLGANSHALLERTGDDAVPSVTAFLIYTGAMGNTGEVLELRDAGGSLVDRVDGSSSWAIGGNNTTKETLQRSGTPPTGGFMTSAPTPVGSAPLAIETNNNTDNTSEGEVAGTNTTRSSSGGNILYGQTSKKEETVRLEPALTLMLPSERTVTVGIPTEYNVHAFRESGKEIFIDDVSWNFGDGTVRLGRGVTHAYAYPGTYVVTVTGHRSSFANDVSDTVRMMVRAVEPDVVIAEATAQYIEIKNVSGDEIDLSGYVLMQGGRAFALPEGTVLLPKTSVRFPYTSTQLLGGGGTALYHPTGALISAFGSVSTPTTPQPRTTYIAPQTVPRLSSVQGAPTTPMTLMEATTSSSTMQASALTAVANSFGADTSGERGGERPLWLWLLGLASAILTTIVVIMLVRRESSPEIIDGFEIETDE